MTREEWLRHAVEELDRYVFEGDLDLLNHNFQIACARVKGSKMTECIQPADEEALSEDVFFPTTIGVSFTIRDPQEMLVLLCYECLHAFFNIKGTGKKFKELAEKYYFEAPYKEVHASSYLKSLIKMVHQSLVDKYGDFPGSAVSFKPKEKKEGKKSTITAFCPECGYELKVSRKVFEKYNGLPTCMCGAHMAQDLEDENTRTETEG